MRISGTKLELLAAKNGLTCARLSELTGISRQSISTIKTRGTCHPETLIKLAGALGVDPENLMKEDAM